MAIETPTLLDNASVIGPYNASVIGPYESNYLTAQVLSDGNYLVAYLDQAESGLVSKVIDPNGAVLRTDVLSTGQVKATFDDEIEIGPDGRLALSYRVDTTVFVQHFSETGIPEPIPLEFSVTGERLDVGYAADGSIYLLELIDLGAGAGADRLSVQMRHFDGETGALLATADLGALPLNAEMLTGGHVFGAFIADVLRLTSGDLVVSLAYETDDSGGSITDGTAQAYFATVSADLATVGAFTEYPLHPNSHTLTSGQMETAATADGGWAVGYIVQSVFRPDVVVHRYDASGEVVFDTTTSASGVLLGIDLFAVPDGSVGVAYSDASESRARGLNKLILLDEAGDEIQFQHESGDVLDWAFLTQRSRPSWYNNLVTVAENDGKIATFWLSPEDNNVYYQSSLFGPIFGTEDADNLTGTDAADMIYGLGENDTLDGGAGNDSIEAGDGDDIVFGGVDRDLLSGENGDDSIEGGGHGDTIYGGVGDDTMDGGPGGDIMYGAHGSDVFIVDNAFDRVIESRSGTGVDLVMSSVDFRMGGSHIENLYLTGTAIIGAGNGLANEIRGNREDNILDGGKNNDTMMGGAGNDTYHVRAPGDTVIEAAGRGLADTVKAYRSYALTDNVERLYMQTVYTKDGDPTLFNGIGNDADNTIVGTPFDNFIIGRYGRDTLKGQAGADTFVFDRALGAENVDRIIDFNVNEADEGDRLYVKGAVVGGMAAGVLSADAFVAGTEAVDGSDRFIFDQVAGRLWFDPDGNGAGAQILMATFEQNAVLTASDIEIF